MFYKLMLYTHSYLRWVVLVLFVMALVKAYQGWLGSKEWTAQNQKTNLFLMISVDLQLLLGIVLYAISPLGMGVFKHGMKVVMKTKLYRFWAVEHLSMMLIAIVVVHVGYALAKRAEAASDKFKKSAIFFSVALLLILGSIPWPFMGSVARGWFRF